MLLTNDVVLLTFVPIAVLALEAAGWQKHLVRVAVLQTIAASLITFKLYLHTRGASPSKFLKKFSIANIATLAIMITLYAVLFVA